MKCIKLDGQASCQPNHGMTCPVFLIIFDWSNDWRPERHVIGCLPPEVLAPSPGTKSLDGNFSVGDGTSKFWVEDVLNSQRHCTYLYSFKKSVVFPLSWVFLIIYRKPKKYMPVTHSLGPGSDCVRPGETESWREASLGFAHHFSSPQEEGSAQCSLFCWCPIFVGTTKMMNVWYV